LHSIDGVGFLI